jgi:beta-glucanase (GH16 family)
MRWKIYAILAVLLALGVAGCRVRVPREQPQRAEEELREPTPPEGVTTMTKEVFPETAAEPMSGEWVMIWNDEFDAPDIDQTKWNHVVAGGGFGNNESQYYTDLPENSFIQDGCLVIQALKRAYKGQHYTSAKLFTQGKGDWTYGRFEIRAKLPFGQGLWPAIWMMPTDYEKYGGWPSCGEIDIAEMVGFKPGTVYGTLHYGNPWKNTGNGFSLPEGQKFADDFHVFALEWVPGRMTWFLDGTPYSTQTEWYTSSPGAMWPAPFDRDFYIQLNVAVGGNWPGQPDATTEFPQQMQVDYVRVYKFTGTFPKVEKRPADPGAQRPREPLPDGNLIYNGTFDAGTSYWELAASDGAEATMTVDDGGVKVSIAKVGTPVWSVQLLQKPLNIERGQTYEVAFDARADQPRELIVKVGKASQHWDNYSGDQVIEIGPAKDRYSFRFQMPQDTDPVARLDFNLGSVAQDVFIDNVTIRPGN